MPKDNKNSFIDMSNTEMTTTPESILDNYVPKDISKISHVWWESTGTVHIHPIDPVTLYNEAPAYWGAYLLYPEIKWIDEKEKIEKPKDKRAGYKQLIKLQE